MFKLFEAILGGGSLDGKKTIIAAIMWLAPHYLPGITPEMLNEITQGGYSLMTQVMMTWGLISKLYKTVKPLIQSKSS